MQLHSIVYATIVQLRSFSSFKIDAFITLYVYLHMYTPICIGNHKAIARHDYVEHIYMYIVLGYSCDEGFWVGSFSNLKICLNIS